jgi:hypothetical protein
VITSLKIHEKDPSKMYMTQGNYTAGQHVFQSIDNGNTWSNITFNLPNIPANTIAVHKENDAIFVGTDLGVYLKTDKSNDWILYSNNLPNTIVNDLKINYTAKTLWAGTYGRGLWSTIMQFSSDTKNENNIDGQPLVFPNPGKGELKIHYTLKQASEVSLTIIDIQGRIISVDNLGSQSPGKQTNRLRTSEMQDGMYFVKLSAGNHQSVIKVIVSGL